MRPVSAAESPSFSPVNFGSPDKRKIHFRDRAIPAIVLQLLHEVRRKMGRVGQLQKRAFRVGIRDDSLRPNFFAGRQESRPWPRRLCTRISMTSAPVRISAPAAFAADGHRLRDRAHSAHSKACRARGMRIRQPRESTEPARFPPTTAREMFQTLREPQSQPATIQSRNIPTRDRRPPSVPSAAAGTCLACPVCGSHVPSSACSTGRRCWDGRYSGGVVASASPMTLRSSPATAQTLDTSPRPSARMPRSPAPTSLSS